MKSDGLPFWKLPLPFHYLSTGIETLSTSRLDPDARPRGVFSFHRPETLLEWAREERVGPLGFKIAGSENPAESVVFGEV